VAGGSLAAIIAGASSASQAFPSSRLVYSRGAGAEQCPEEEALRKEVAARLGYDPFFVWAERTIVARIERARQGFRATVQLLDAKGIVQGSRSLSSSSNDCADVATSVALVISIGIDPEHAQRQAREDTPVPLPEPSASISSVAPAAMSAAPPDRASDIPNRATPTARIEPEAGAGAWTAAGLAPRVSFGLAAWAGLTWSPAALYLEGRDGFDAGDDISTSVLALSLVPCVRRDPLFACFVGSWGELRAEASRSATARYLSAGARLGFDLEIFHQLFLRTHLDGAVPLDRTIIQVNGRTAWQLPVLSGALGVEASLHFR
jgi:hypothetical protein